MDIQHPLVQEFHQALEAGRRLYRDSGRLIVRRYPELAWKEPAALIELMDDLHAGLLVKTYFSIALADRRWSSSERVLAQVLIEHIWHQRLAGEELRETAFRLSHKAESLRWYGLVRPFAELAPLRKYVASVEAIVVRVANVVAKIDGTFCDAERRALASIQHELETHLRPLSLDDYSPSASNDRSNDQAHNKHFDTRAFAKEAQEIAEACELDGSSHADALESDFEDSLDSVLDELQSLIGLGRVKDEIKTLTNLLRLQQERKQRGMPPTEVSLHMVLTGNPGTGKTTVARLVARIFGAMVILERGHLVETDRSGLVAEYAGQTGPKTNTRVDEALDGVLFVDEAYSLVAEGDDPFGREALQTLLKRMEDDRDRLVVILAGYPQPMKDLLATNPGLSSRFNRHLRFDDYEPVELARIFARLCEASHFELTGPVRAKLLVAFDWLYRNRDEHFGNGRASRNMFETAVRRMANRIAGAREITRELLSRFDVADLHVEQIPTGELDDRLAEVKFRVACPGCQTQSLIVADFLGRHVRCKCQKKFRVDWGKPVCE